MANETTAHPWRACGYREETDAEGNLILFAQRSPLDTHAQEIVCHPAIIKELLAKYLLLEAEQVLRPVRSEGAVIPVAVRIASGVIGQRGGA